MNILNKSQSQCLLWTEMVSREAAPVLQMLQGQMAAVCGDGESVCYWTKPNYLGLFLVPLKVIYYFLLCHNYTGDVPALLWLTCLTYLISVLMSNFICLLLWTTSETVITLEIEFEVFWICVPIFSSRINYSLFPVRWVQCFYVDNNILL